MNVTRKSILSGVTRTQDLNVTEEQMNRYLSRGMLIQHAFPKLSADDREFIMTGITPDEWEKEFGEEE